MPEPDRPIEKLLQASAEERRRQAGGPFELHPATRRLLQGEVARQYVTAATVATPRRSWFELWPRLAWSLGTFLVLGMAAWVTWQSHQSAREDTVSLADRSPVKNQFAKEEDTVASAPEALAPTAEAPTAVKDSAAEPTPVPASTAEVASSRTAESQPPPADLPKSPAPVPTRSASRDLETDAARMKMAENKAVLADASAPRRESASPPAVAAQPKTTLPKAEPSALAAATPSEATFLRSNSLGAPERSRVVMVAEPSQASQAFLFSNQIKTPITNTLASFTVEQNGADLRVVDADGSIYTGQVLLADMAPAPEARAVQTRQFGGGGGAGGQALRSQSQVQSQFMNQNALNFRVAGTNRSLKQNVVFTGNFVPANEAANAQMVSNAAALQNNRVSNQAQLRNQQQLQQQLPWNNGRISGQAVLDNKQTIAVEASPSQK
jgi:hypothetical protein